MQFWHFYHTCRSVIYPSAKEPFQKHARADIEYPCQKINLWITREPSCSNILALFHVPYSLVGQHSDSQPPWFPTVYTHTLSSLINLEDVLVFFSVAVVKHWPKATWGGKGLFSWHSMLQPIIEEGQDNSGSDYSRDHDKVLLGGLASFGLLWFSCL